MDTALERALSVWRRARAWETRLVMRSDRHQLVLFRRHGEHNPWVELGHGGRASERRDTFTRIGLSRRRWAGGGKAWGRTFDPRIEADALAGALRSLWEDTADDTGYAVDVTSQDEEPPSNPRLIDAIRAAAARQDERTRQELYAALVNATLLVPIEPATSELPAHEQRPLCLEVDAAGPPVWAAFSDWDALRQWSPAGHAFGPVHGAEFFAHVHDLGRCGVRINPGGVVGGELYPAEVEMMVEAVRRFYRKTLS